MTLQGRQIERIVDELQCLCGARVQRIDLVADAEIVLELRIPGRTLRLMLAATPDVGRIHLIDRRPPKTVDGGSLQALLRRRLGGAMVTAVRSRGSGVFIDTDKVNLSLELGRGRRSITVSDSVSSQPGEPRPEPVVPQVFPVSEEIRNAYAERVVHAETDRLRRAATHRIRGQLRKLRRLESNLTRDLEKLARMAQQGPRAELLKTALSTVRRGDTQVEVMDWQTGQPQIISLDPRLGPKANMQRMFDKAKKAARGTPIVSERLAGVRARLDELEARLESIAAASEEALREAHVDPADPADPAAPSTTPRPPSELDRIARRFVACDGSEILVGKGARENDRLTLGYARGVDVWLHARGIPGSHVILRQQKGAPTRQDALLDAAHLAAFYSDARGDPKVEVLYTTARYVKKLKGAPPGLVSVSREKTMMLRVEAACLDRLLGRRTRG